LARCIFGSIITIAIESVEAPPRHDIATAPATSRATVPIFTAACDNGIHTRWIAAPPGANIAANRKALGANTIYNAPHLK